MGTLNDRTYKYLGDLGFSGSLNDRMVAYWASEGFSGSFNDRCKAFLKTTEFKTLNKWMESLDGSVNPITGTGPVIAPLTDGDTLSSAVTWGSYLPGGATADRQMRVDGGAWVAYVGGTEVAEGEVWEAREVVSYGAWTSTFASAAQTVAEAPAPTIPVIVSPGSIEAQPLVGQAMLVAEPEVTGATSTAYQWYDGDPAGSGTPISGWTSAAPTPTATQYALAAPIWRRATYTNDAGSVVEDLQAPAVVGHQFREDWSGFAVGNTWTQIDTTYNRTASGVDTTVVADAAAPAGRAVQVIATTTNPRPIWNAAEAAFGASVSATTNRIQGLFLFKHTGTNSGRYWLRFINSALTDVAFPGVTVFNGNCRLQINTDTSSDNVGELLGTLTPGSYYWLRLEQAGVNIRGKLWAFGSPEPAAFVGRVCSAAFSPPAPCFGPRYASSVPAAQFDLLYRSAGYNADAPFWFGFLPPPPAAPDMEYAASASGTTASYFGGEITYTMENI